MKKLSEISIIDADNLFAESIEAKNTKLGADINEFSHEFSVLVKEWRLNKAFLTTCYCDVTKFQL